MLQKKFQHQAFGSITSLTQTAKGLQGKSENGIFEIVPYSNHTIRISFHLFETLSYQSYAVIASPAKEKLFTLIDNKDHYVYEGKQFDIVIQKTTTALTFLDKKKNIINEDDTTLNLSSIGYEFYNYKKVFADEKFIGLGEKVGDLNRRGKLFTHKNSDAFAYGPDTDPIYSSIPFYIGLHSGQQQYGVFLDNPSISTFSFGVSNDRNMFFSAENGRLDYYFMYDNSPKKIIQHYTALTGRMEMPPLWSLGFQQSRYSYYPEFKIDEIVKGFENRNIPIDAIHFDIHYMDAYKAFTWDKKRFPQAKKMLSELSKKGIQAVAILDPGIKVEKGYHAYDSGIKHNHFITYPDGKVYSGSVWPGVCHFPDFTNPKVRKWWADMCKFYINDGFKGLWNDMNEPAVWGQKIPDYLVLNNEGNSTSFKDIRNAYSSLMSRSTAEGFALQKPNDRKFILTRAAYAGIQRYAAKWTGDNIANEEHLFLGVRLVNTLGISGVAFSGVDIGGFVADTDQQLFARWISVGCFLPFFRAHKMINARSSEPWHFGEVVEQIAKNYIQLRYRLIPYLYQYFYRSARTGEPINTSLALAYPFNEKVFEPTYQHQFLFGDNILVCPIGTKETYVKIYLPPNEGGWYDFYTDTLYQDNQELLWVTEREVIPVFVKAGSILPLQKLCMNLTTQLSTHLEWHIYPNKNKNIVSSYYEDDGTTHDWNKKKSFTLQDIQYHASTTTFEITTKQKSKCNRFKTSNIFIHHEQPIKITLLREAKKKTISLQKTAYQIVANIPNFDPFSNEEKGLKEVMVMQGKL